MPGWLQRSFVGLIAFTLVAVPPTYYFWRVKNYRNLRVVEDGVLYRSGQLSLAGLQRIVHDYGIKTVVTLRYPEDPSEPGPDHAEEAWCQDKGIYHIRLRQKNYVANVGVQPPQEENIKIFLDTMTDKTKFPVLVHCYAGKNRTGAMCAIYRMEYSGWSPKKAIEEMKAFGYDNIAEHEDLLNYLLNYQPKGYASLRGEQLLTGTEEQFFFASEDLKDIEKEWRRFWKGPSHLTPLPVHGGIGPSP